MFKNKYTKLCQSLGFDINKNLAQNEVALGEYNSYEIAIIENAIGQLYFISIPVNTSDLFKKDRLSLFLDSIQHSNKHIRKIIYEDSSIKIECSSIFSFKKFMTSVKDVLDDVTEHLHSNGFKSSCGLCGEDKVLNPVTLNFRPLLYCEDCIEKTDQSLAKERELDDARPSITGKAFFFSLLAGILASLAWVLASNFFQLDSILFNLILVSVVAFTFKKFNDKWDKKGMILVISIIIFCLLLIQYLLFSLEIYYYINLDYIEQISFFEVFLNTFDIIIHDFTSVFIVLEELAITIFFIVLILVAITKEYKSSRNITKI